MKRRDHPKELGGQTIFCSKVKRPLPADQVEGLGQVNVGDIQRSSLLAALVLELSSEDDHVRC